MVTESLGESVCFPDSCFPTLKSTAVLRVLPGGTKSVLVHASDGNTYVVKLMGNPQGPNVLANEALGTELARHLGLSVPAWRAIEVSDEFLDRNKLCWFETDSGPIRPDAGLHFASRVIGQGAPTPTYGVLPGEWLSLIDNRDDFVGMLLLDVWANHTDNRQSVFVRNPVTQKLTAVFVDYGHMFGGPSGRDSYRRGTAMYLDHRVYESLDIDAAFDRWLQRVRMIDGSLLRRVAKSIPGAWMGGLDLEELIAQLQMRKGVLEHFLHQEMSLVKGMGIGSPKEIEARDEFNVLGRKPAVRVRGSKTHVRERRIGTNGRESAAC